MQQSDIIAFFDRLAPRWDEGQRRNESVIRAILDAAGITEGVSVLDVGCGTGVLFPDYLARNVRSLTAVDISPEMIRVAAGKFSDPRLTLLTGDVETLRFEDSFDRCVVYNAFPHFPEPARLIRRLAGLLVPGGRLTIAHGMSRAAIDAHHAGGAKEVSRGLMDERSLAALFEPCLEPDLIVSDEEKYIVSGLRRP
ncbi:MAG: class I SAM-dependent methyltransferase [Clostridia bacterium]|nr:class I SAM-dependent methyltransferase [Clostridia bacterium]